MSTCSWPLGNGQSLSFHVYSENKGWKKIPGLYIFAFEGKAGSWHALYVGQTDDFSSRLPTHEKLNEAVQRGTTHVHALHVASQFERNRLERMLINHLQPPMNEQLRMASNY